MVCSKPAQPGAGGWRRQEHPKGMRGGARRPRLGRSLSKPRSTGIQRAAPPVGQRGGGGGVESTASEQQTQDRIEEAQKQQEPSGAWTGALFRSFGPPTRSQRTPSNGAQSLSPPSKTSRKNRASPRRAGLPARSHCSQQARAPGAVTTGPALPGFPKLPRTRSLLRVPFRQSTGEPKSTTHWRYCAP